MKGSLYTSYFSKIKYGKGTKISIARFSPKWLKPQDITFFFKDLAPKPELLSDYKNGKCDWDEYTTRYLNNLIFSNDVWIQKELDVIKRILDDGKDVTIYCYEKPTDNCHRHLLGNLFKQNGYEVKEIE